MKPVNLTEAIDVIKRKLARLEDCKKREIRQIEEKYQRAVERYKAALAALEELNEACPNCRGSGSERYLDASGNWDMRKCPDCDGTGINIVRVRSDET